ncbi:MAG: hypothetical protein IMY73_03525 [Bacteroidetes bacterium]|nr:hypothetical protein [Bacteroidota bacterium]
MSNIDVSYIIEENKNRLEEENKPYDPLTGIGSPIKRFSLEIDKNRYLLLPELMLDNEQIKDMASSKNINAYARKHKIPIKKVMLFVLKLRIKYDYEYWCATCVKIQDKITKNIVPFILRKPQLELLKILNKQIEKQEPIRIILLKARQWGGSTMIQIFMAWIQIFHRRAWHSVIVADVEDQSRNIKSMYSRLASMHPKEIYEIKFENFEGSSKTKIIRGRECIVYLGSMQKPDSLRSADVMMAHLSEVGLWKSTDGKKPEDLIQSIAGTVPLTPYSMIVMESTAKGIGNFFHREWVKATTNQSGYIPLFIPWFMIDMYKKPFENNDKKVEFIRDMSKKEMDYFQLGATLEGINWYRDKKHLDSYDDWRMGCEFPTTPQEAFQSTGRRAHSPMYVDNMRKYAKKAVYVGDMFADEHHGKKAINDSLCFREYEGGFIWLWALPDKKTNIRRRYIVSMDIGGRNDGADWSVISIIDRYWLTDGGVEECIGTAKFHLDQDLAIWKAVQISKYFNNALLVIEANSLNPKGTEGDHTLTILDEIKGIYENLYCRTDPQRIVEGYPERYGFFTSRASKSDLINQMNKRLREESYIERDSRALDEIDMYEIKEDGTFGAIDGEHDDIYMSRAIGLKASQTYEEPKIVE